MAQATRINDLRVKRLVVENSLTPDYAADQSFTTVTATTSVATDTIAEHTAATGVTVDGLLIKDKGLVVGASGAIDLNGEANALVFDADGNTKLDSATDNTLKLYVNGAEDFRVTANTLTALSGSTIATNTIAETTAASGVTIDGVLCKDSAVTGNVTGNVTGTLIGGQQDAVVPITGDGAITIAPCTVLLSKGSAAAITLAAPTTVTHDGYIIRIVAISAQAHVVTGSVDGYNAKGASGTLTFGGALGDSVTLVAYGGHWYTLAKVNVTVA